MFSFRRILLVSVLVMMARLLQAQAGIEKHFKIYDTRTRQVATVAQIAEACQDADVLFFGEEHNDSAGHYLETAIFQALYDRYGSQLALSMEMFESDCQLALNEYLQGYIPEDRMLKDARPWNNYKDYRPTVEIARQHQLDVIAANVPRRYVSMVSRKGMRSLDSLPRVSRQFLPPLPFDTATGRYREKFYEVMSNGSPGSGNPRVYYSQNLWDAGMSYNIYRYWRKNRGRKIFHMVGNFHCDEKLGTLAQLQHRSKKIKILNISCFSDASFDAPNWDQFGLRGDFVIITDPNLKKTF